MGDEDLRCAARRVVSALACLGGAPVHSRKAIYVTDTIDCDEASWEFSCNVAGNSGAVKWGIGDRGLCRPEHQHVLVGIEYEERCMKTYGVLGLPKRSLRVRCESRQVGARRRWPLVRFLRKIGQSSQGTAC